MVLFITFHNENRNIIILTSKSHSEPKRVIVFHADYRTISVSSTIIIICIINKLIKHRTRFQGKTISYYSRVCLNVFNDVIFQFRFIFLIEIKEITISYHLV
jgi:hypothetical protein